ncbi:MAG TPA: ATP-dependent DNA helicase, partial [Vicinamibacteria bacterium]|nr:ATP-dependent DNA helicase [Vicinamibacteria bacterium]
HSLRSGDLNLESGGRAHSVEAIRAHQRLQDSRPKGYEKELPVFGRIEEEDVVLEIQGRIDGALGSLVEEIKTVATRDDIPWDGKREHWGQLEVYAYLYAEDKELESVEARLTYSTLDTGEVRELGRRYHRSELASIFRGLVSKFLLTYRQKCAWLAERDASIRATEFPFTRFRRGQREMAIAVYRTLRDGGELLLQAATGIGKTQATLFPAVKALSEGRTKKLFYVTARTTGRALAEKAVFELGGRLRTVTLTARDKICFNPEKACNGGECSFARGFYERIESAVEEALRRDLLTRETIEEVARRHDVCPFELSLELTPWADLVICDYNYVFDPRAYVRRLFDDRKLDFALLVDEAHNLIDRARDMFSADLRKKPFLDLRRCVSREEQPQLHRALGEVNAFLLAARKRGTLSLTEPPEELLSILRRLVDAAEPVLAAGPRSWRGELLERYFDAIRFLKVGDDWGDEYIACYEPRGRDLRLKLFCTDPARRLSERLGSAKAAVFFSATLTPPGYFWRLLGCREKPHALRFASPFPRENLAVFVASEIATTYRRRADSREGLTELLSGLVDARKGKYLVYFPSYEYLNAVHERFVSSRPELAVSVQRPDMDERERGRFLAQFDADGRAFVGFAVLGGVFGEGIDLPGERLAGAAIVGVGLPPPSPEREHIREHFERESGRGYDFAYVYPGVNRVLQAAGRVIRSETDRGVLLLIDERFAEARYRALLPLEWRPIPIRGAAELRGQLTRFWAG